MRFRVSITAALALLLVVCLFTPAQAGLFGPDSKLEKQYLAKIDQLIPGMGAAKIVDRKDAQMEFEHLCLPSGAPGKEKEREALSIAIMKRVGPAVPMPARVWLLRKIETIGRDEVVSPLAKLLHDTTGYEEPSSPNKAVVQPQIRELARRALENNPSSKAGAALRDELKVAKEPAWRASIINALAFRQDGDAVKAIAADLDSADPVIAKAALAALGEIGTAPAIKTLSAELAKLKTVEAGDLVVDACMRAAGRAAARGDNEAASSLYSAVWAKPIEVHPPATGETIPMAAMAGIAAVEGANAVHKLLPTITAKEATYGTTAARLQLAAASYVQRIPGEKATLEIAAAVADANPNAQVVLLDTLGRRGDAAAAPTVGKYLKAPVPEVRAAAIGALRYVGNGTSVETLANFAATATGAERDAARESLKWVKGTDVDAAILKLIPSAQDRIKAELVRAAAVRLMKPAFDQMLAFVGDKDETVRTPVIYNIGKLAQPKDLPKVLKAFSAAPESSLGTVKEAVGRICERIPNADERAQVLITAMKSADPATQGVILQILADVKGQVALQAMRTAAKSDNEQIKKAASKALATWGPIYLTQWVYAGPFRKDGAKATDLFDEAFPPEDADAKVKWKPLKNAKGPDINLAQIDKGENCCGYLRTSIMSDKDQDVVMTFGSDDGIKVWLDGKVINAKNVARGLKVDEDQVKASLKKGENVLLVKVTQGASDWKVSVGIKAAEGGPPSGVTCEAK